MTPTERNADGGSVVAEPVPVGGERAAAAKPADQGVGRRHDPPHGIERPAEMRLEIAAKSLRPLSAGGQEQPPEDPAEPEEPEEPEPPAPSALFCLIQRNEQVVDPIGEDALPAGIVGSFQGFPQIHRKGLGVKFAVQCGIPPGLQDVHSVSLEPIIEKIGLGQLLY